MGWRQTTLTIESGNQNSEELDLDANAARRKAAIEFLGPTALTGTVTIQLKRPSDNAWVTLQSGGSDVSLPAAKCTTVDVITGLALRLHSSGAEGADRVFDILGVAES